MATISEALQLALQHHRAGRLDLAEEIYRRILAVEPGHADAWHLLGVIAYQAGQPAVAVDYMGRAIAISPSDADYHNNLGIAFKDQGKLDEAIACYRRALELKPDYAGAHNNLGVAFKNQGKLDEAVACYRRAVELKPDYAEAHNNLGLAFQDQGKLDEAVACYRRAVELKPDYAEAHNNLGIALKDLGQLDEALVCYRRALQINPGLAEAQNNLGNVLDKQGRLDEAIACYRRALQLNPGLVEAQNGLGNVFKEQGKLDEAIACYQRALKRRPDYAEAHKNLGNAWKDMGQLEEAIASYRRTLEFKPDYAPAHSNLLLTLQYLDDTTLKRLAEAHAAYERQHAARLRATWRLHDRARDPDRSLRLGFVSSDFGWHPVGYFLIRAMENLHRQRYEVVCYSDRMLPDGMTLRFKAAASSWRDTFGLSHQQLAEQIDADRIDILFDLAGHTAQNRLLVFARKPAPIQVTWLGYVGTTGLGAMDYILADHYQVPSEAEPHYCENVLRLRDSYVCFDPPADAPPVGPLPALATGRFTFGSFNNPAKITPRVVATWARLLRRLPESRLFLKYRGLDSPDARSHFQQLFAAHGVAGNRLELAGLSPHPKLLSSYNQVDLALDPFPYNGGLTTCEALWMGVPVITCPGETFASRQSLSHLSNVGLTETIASNLQEYVDFAVNMANDLPRLTEIRSGLRQRVAESPLCDGKRFAANLMVLLRGVWREWCSGLGAT